MYKKSTLENGVRIIKALNKNTDTVTVLAIFGVGSRDEKGKNEGIAHFLEHMFFKGTEKRPAANIISKELDYAGAASNAFTGKEYTGFWVKISKENVTLALDIISDFLLNSKFDKKEIENEKGAVIEEINMYEDSPMRDIPAVLENLLYNGQVLGHDQLGSKENVRNFDRKDLLNFYKKHYKAENMVLAISGNFSEKKIDAEIEKFFIPFKESEKACQKMKVSDKKQSGSEICIKNKKTDQTNFSLGFRAFNIGHKDEHAADLLDVILGGNSSSRLYEIVREKFGLAYYIYTYNASYRDVGYFAVQSGVGNDKCEKALELIIEEIRRIRDEGISDEELDRAKKYIRGRMSISLESSDAIANFITMQEISGQTILTPKEKFDKINQVQKTDIERVAREIFQEKKANLALIGPSKNKAKFEKLLKKL